MTESPFHLISTDASLIIFQHLEGQNMFNALLTCKWLHNLITNSKHYQELHKAWKQRQEMFRKCMDYIKNQDKLCEKCKNKENMPHSVYVSLDLERRKGKVFKVFSTMEQSSITECYVQKVGKLSINEIQVHQTVPICVEGNILKYLCLQHLLDESDNQSNDSCDSASSCDSDCE
ncbi:MAG: hypothetical protein QW303_01515 [Nitrososphaerota archaeon]